MMTLKNISTLTLSLLIVFQVSAQDTSKKTIEITSSFKPVLRNAAKINFNATPPPADTSRPRLQYTIPAQNVIPGLLPVALKPLALIPDSNAGWSNSNYIKLGYGNLATPFLQAGVTIPAGKTNLNLLADHVSSKGKLEYQDYGETHIKGYMFTPLSDKIQLQASLGLSDENYYQYGYDHVKYNFSKDDLKRRFTTISGEIGIRNPVPTEYGISYNPRLNIDMFSDNTDNHESSARLRIPIEKYIGKSFGLKLGIDADVTRYSPKVGEVIDNNLFQVPVALTIRTPNLKVNGGVIPSWDNGVFKLLPNILVDFPIAGEKWIIQGGWLSYFNKGSYQRFASINPYLSAPKDLRNNRMIERFVGFKGTVLEHYSYNAKIGYAEFRNVPLFVNDTASGKSFGIIFEEALEAIQLQGEIGVVEAERFSLSARFNYYKFNSQRTEARAWGLIPLEFTTNLRWNLMKDFWLTSDLFMWDGALHKNKDGSSGRSPSAVDLNAGLEFKVTKNIFLWSQFNNLFNSKYQRWNQYDNYGFNMLIGGIYRFNQ
jgi:hypothetical protein